ncbi:ERMES complex subunit MDM12 KNAG_0I01710 [Huiozyma naganishii CBS 8797]|uniref:SMP-LTD domain-containing protein n=1 Tax=Huiozyma naganishii (strain ATCC MYA-139 / BCRC 22969 / CBS 8797 / KCTC 17520 / NBRC 10181 / NCYC 3082 / Yp74L-3) TaxID=1071383 RepID=J7SA73_HUIN7|nr:hypothetical protein KNAG_0I01710 [Kazachstania naganishii CBS 8797]CCK71956.1 hypothetical protein KNAG_0I01710 [Kazachstania naganishii CBS 8797]
MSFEINWDQIQHDNALNSQIRAKLNNYFESVELPSYLQDLQITNFQLGTVAPAVILHEIDTPLTIIESEPSAMDVQSLVELKYNGDMVLNLSVSLVSNYPDNNFMTLPVKINISLLKLHCLCLVAYLKRRKRVVFSIVCDVGDDEDFTASPLDHCSKNIIMGKTLDWNPASSPLERLSIVRHLRIETEIGDDTVNKKDGTTLRSVDKLEQFILTKFKDFLRKEIGWPSWLTLEFDDEEDEEEEDDDDEDDDDDKSETHLNEQNQDTGK